MATATPAEHLTWAAMVAKEATQHARGILIRRGPIQPHLAPIGRQTSVKAWARVDFPDPEAPITPSACPGFRGKLAMRRVPLAVPAEQRSGLRPQAMPGVAAVWCAVLIAERGPGVRKADVRLHWPVLPLPIGPPPS